MQECAAVHAYVSNLTLMLLAAKTPRWEAQSAGLSGIADAGKSTVCSQASEILEDSTIARHVVAFLAEPQGDICCSSSCSSSSSSSSSSTAAASDDSELRYLAAEPATGSRVAWDCGMKSDTDLSDDDAEDLVVFEEDSFSTATLEEMRWREATSSTRHVQDGDVADFQDGGLSNLMRDSITVMEAADKYVFALDDLVTAQAAFVADKCSAACQVLDSRATKCVQLMAHSSRQVNSGAVKITSKAKATAAVVRSKTGDLATTEGMRKSLEAARSKVEAQNVRKGWHAARDKMQSAFSSSGLRSSVMRQAGA